MPRGPRSDDYIPVAETDHEGFTPDDRFQHRYERQREKVERMEEQFLEQLKRDVRENRAKIARDFLDYSQKNPQGARARIQSVWGGEANGSDYTGYDPNLEPDEDS